jgi:ATP-dependent RNA helicase HelY
VTNPRSFTLDSFQQRAAAALDEGSSVLVAAPTGAGKTVVAEHAIAIALAEGGRAFYTTPIKALSNQKYRDLIDTYGAERVGLLTGDHAVNADASVVVMTTEVLRNMLYAASPALRGLTHVVLDEVHFLQDAYRGPVWEEVIIHLDPSVRLVCLSATVSNADELAAWLTSVRGPTVSVVEHQRPVELVNLFAVDDRQGDRLTIVPVLRNGQPNPEGARYDERGRAGTGGGPRRRYATPRRLDIIDELQRRDLLPVIYFIFSRNACDDAARVCLEGGVRLTTPSDRARITEIVAEHTSALSDGDLLALDHATWFAALLAGVAAHHAGMVPPFKEAVEACFVEGLVKVVFATETLALGINMPARTVVIEKLTKYNGDHHEFLTPAQFTQLTGRAGRRGIDPIGHAVSLWSPFVPFADVATLAASRDFELRSSFRPTYNMAVHLVERHQPSEAHRLLNQSFAQFQSDRSVVTLESRRRRHAAAVAELEAAASCDRGDAAEYAALIESSKRQRTAQAVGVNADLVAAMSALRPGDVIGLPGKGGGGLGAVLSISHRRGGAVRIRVLSEQRRVLNLGESSFLSAPNLVGRLVLPTPFAPHNSRFQRTVADLLIDGEFTEVRPTAPTPSASVDAPRRSRRAEDHPVHECPERDRHLQALRRLGRARASLADGERRISEHTETLARTFDRVLQLLEAWEYLQGWELTERGRRLGRIFHESDLLVAEAVSLGLFDDLDPPSVAALASCFTYEHRSRLPAAPPWFPSSTVRHRVAQIDELARELTADEHRLRLDITRLPDAGFMAVAHGWASGEALADVLDEAVFSGGDFVRNVRVLIDLLGQLAMAAERSDTATAARSAAESLFRGVVAASSAVREP